MTLFALSCSLNEEVNIQYNQFFGSDFTHCKSFTVNVTVSVLLSQAMRRNSNSSAVAFFALLSALLKLNEGRLLEGYKFPVYTTESCPKSNAEWLERSSSLQCNATNGYMCIPNEEISVLLEFCYHVQKTLIPKGACLILYKHSSAVDGYKCGGFSFGCPSSPYFSNKIYEQQSCVSIGKGCFLAEPDCNRNVLYVAEPKNPPLRYNTEENIEPDSNETEEKIVMLLRGSGIFLGIFISFAIFSSILSAINKKWKSTNDTQKKIRYEEKSEKFRNLEEVHLTDLEKFPLKNKHCYKIDCKK